MKKEEQEIFFSFRRDKSPRHDVLPTDIYLGFYDLPKEDILGVVEESRVLRKKSSVINTSFLALIQKKKWP